MLGLAISYSKLLAIATVVGFWTNYLLPVALIGYTIWWAYTLRKGSKIHRSTLALHILVYGFAAFYVYLVSFTEFYADGDTLQLTGVLWMVGALAITYTAVRVGMWYGARTLAVHRTETGEWHLRGPIEIAVFWASLFAVRMSLETFVLGGYSVLFPIYPLPSGISDQAFASVVILIASLYLVSFGFLSGISITEWNLHSEMMRANALADSEPPSEPPVATRGSGSAPEPDPPAPATSSGPP